MSSNKWVWWHRYSGCIVVYNGYNVVNYIGCDLINTVGVLSSIECMWWHRYSGHDVKYTVCDVLEMVDWGHKVRMWCLVWCKRCHTYGECDVLQRVWVMWSIPWVWWHIKWLWCHMYSVYVALHTVCGFIYRGFIYKGSAPLPWFLSKQTNTENHSYKVYAFGRLY